jgi:sec-independent protein translocase protein TatA
VPGPARAYALLETGQAVQKNYNSLRKTKMIGDLFDSPWKILIVALVIIVLFGSRKLPHAARSLGQSMRILKTEVQGLHEDEPASPATQAPATQAAPAAPAAPAELQQQTAAANAHGPRGHQADTLTRGPREMG